MNKSEAVLAATTVLLASAIAAVSGYVVGVAEGRDDRAEAMRSLERRVQ